MSYYDILKKFPTTVNALPDGEFLAILYPRQTHVPGDERSIKNPGHGYPAHTVSSWDIEVFPTREEWESEIIRLENDKAQKPYKAIRAMSAQISTKVSVDEF